MSMEYIRRTYGVPVKRGMRVRIRAFDGWTDGRVTSATHYVVVAPDQWPNARLRYHPTDYNFIRYQGDGPTHNGGESDHG